MDTRESEVVEVMVETDELDKELMAAIVKGFPEGIEEDVLLRTFERLREMAIDGVIYEGVLKGKVRCCWDFKKNDLVIQLNRK